MVSPDPLSTRDAVAGGKAPDAWVVFKLDELELALALPTVDRVLRAVEISPLPEAPRGVRGMINLHGQILPVFDMRLRFGLPPRDVHVSDHLVLARTHARTVAMLVDSVAGVVSRDEVHITPASDILPELAAIESVMTMAGSMVLVHDLERFLSMEEYEALQKLIPVPS